MTVYLEAIKTKGNVIKGEIRKLEHIKEIKDCGGYVEYIVGENHKTIWSKEMHRIAFIIM